ncbi:hypothetical protein [Kordia sp.]|uniref:hypothetical protein n=1 Tax=Kordia sp. TaxID=1965332 RepID=UPI003D2D6B87
MEKKYTVEGTYQVNNGEEKEFSFDYTNSEENVENNNKLLQILDKPYKLILQGGKHGVKGVRRFFSIVFLFLIANLCMVIYAINRMVVSGFGFGKSFMLVVIFLAGIGFTIYAGYRTYQYVVIDTMRVIYENSTSLFQKISDLVIGNVEKLFTGKKDVKQSDLKKALNFSKMVHQKYQKVPRFIRKGMIMVLKKVPFVGMLVDLQEDINSGNNSVASAKLYTKVDSFISGTVFGNNNTKWVLWLLPLNILLMYLFIRWKIG